MLVIFKNLKVIFKINGEVLVNYINELDTVLLNRYIAEQVLNLYVLNDWTYVCWCSFAIKL